MNVLITGGNGFIGAQVMRHAIAKGWDVAALLRPGADLSRIAELAGRYVPVEGSMDDLTWTNHLPFSPDVCIHLAWYAVPGLYPHAIENVASLSSTLDLIPRLSERGCGRFYGVGTCFEYDFDQGWMREDTPLKPASLYAACKAAAWMALPKLGDKLGMQTGWLRPFYQYGPFEDPKRLVAAVTLSLLKGERVETTEGGQVRDFSHVSDVGSGIVAAVDAGLTGAVNLGSGVPVTVRQIIEILGREIGRLDLVQFGARPYNPTDPPFVVSNNARLRTETVWKPEFDLTHGLRASIEFWRSRLG